MELAILEGELAREYDKLDKNENAELLGRSHFKHLLKNRHLTPHFNHRFKKNLDHNYYLAPALLGSKFFSRMLRKTSNAIQDASPIVDLIPGGSAVSSSLAKISAKVNTMRAKIDPSYNAPIDTADQFTAQASNFFQEHKKAILIGGVALALVVLKKK